MQSERIEIEHRSTSGGGEYVAHGAQGAGEAKLTWQARGETRVADHTFVPPALRGQGIAEQLVNALIDDARSEGFKIVPSCSYVEAQFRRHPEWADLRA